MRVMAMPEDGVCGGMELTKLWYVAKFVIQRRSSIHIVNDDLRCKT